MPQNVQQCHHVRQKVKGKRQGGGPAVNIQDQPSGVEIKGMEEDIWIYNQGLRPDPWGLGRHTRYGWLAAWGCGEEKQACLHGILKTGRSPAKAS